MAVAKTKDGRWYCYYDIRDESGRKRRKKEYFGRGAAGEVAAWRRNDALGLGQGSGRRKKRPNDITFAQISKEYFGSRQFSEKSRRELKIRLESILLPFFGHLPATSITHGDLDRYIKWRRKNPNRNYKKNKRRAKKIKYSTINRELTDVQAILNFAVRRQPPLIAFNPVATYKKPANDDEIIDPPSPAEAQKILKKASGHLVRCIWLAWFLGLRPGAVEMLSLRWDSVNFDDKIIRINAAKKGGVGVRYIPIHDSLYEKLEAWAKADKRRGPIIHYHGKPVKTIQTAWEGALSRAGIHRRIRPYDLRHHFVTSALEAGADIKALSEIVGSRPETLMRHYQHVSKELHRSTVAKVQGIDE